MLQTQYFRRVSAMCLLVFAVILAGCGGATDTTSDSAEPTANNQVEQAAEESTSAEQTEEVAVEEEAEPESQASESQPVAGTAAAECLAATPENDQLMALLQPNSAIAQVSDDDWSKGPSDAPITIVEYGDFQ